MADPQDIVEYREIQGHPGYRVGNDGSVWSCLVHHGSQPATLGEEWKRLKPGIITDGYLAVTLSNRKQKKVHHLVLEEFVGPCPYGMQGCHFPDRDVTNNHLNNLRWDTSKSNHSDRIVHGTQPAGVKNPSVKLTEEQVYEIRDLEGKLPSRRVAAMFSLDKASVLRIWKRHPHGGWASLPEK